MISQNGTIKKGRKNLSDFISAAVIFLFIYAAASKIHDFEKFRIQIGKSPILNSFTSLVSIGVPSFELIIVVLLFTKRLNLIGLYATVGLMVAFSTYIAYILTYSSYIPCSCGGVLENMSWLQHLYFNICYILLSIIGVMIYPSNR